MGPQLTIRTARHGDLPAINDIYNHYVLSSTCTFQTEPETVAGRESWFAAHGPNHPVLVAEYGNRVTAWASLSRFHPRAAYRHTVEDSIYVHQDMHGRGIGTSLLAALIQRASELEHRSIVALISADQTTSLHVHEKFRFNEVGRIKDAGQKFGKWIDVVYMQRML